ncbi:MAG: hypothetical protein IJC66_13745 [Kiritimatiellae bacterium]|nr:hypothetical protein [Kiritimatiellia bacterium]
MMKTGLSVLAVVAAGLAFGGVSRPPTVMNIVNFVRGTEPRYPDRDLVEPLREEIKLNTAYHLPNTILLQYDALLRDDLVAAAKSAEQDKTEYGVWFEMCRQQVEACGIPWRGRKGWDWEWFVNPGFLMAYTPAERERIVDETFRLFKERFGQYPRVAGSWLLDAHSMDYMNRRYGMDAFCICKEQDSTDAYGLRGGYGNGAYYPSKNNAISAAVEMKNAIPVPVFRMLTPDPIFNYGKLISCKKLGAKTLEPACHCGCDKAIVDWYFRVYTGPGLLGLSYMQTGQENSFGWENIGRGLPYQIERIAELSAKGKIRVEKFGETGRAFKAKHPENIPQTLVALENWSDEPYKSAWYNSKHYRMNLFYDGRRVFFRDIHKFCDGYAETYLKKACAKWFCSYFTPPIVDGAMLKGGEYDGMAYFGGEFTSFDVATSDEKTLKVTAGRADGTSLTVVFEENRILIDFGLDAETSWEAAQLKFRGGGEFFSKLDFPPGFVKMEFDGFKYQIAYDGDMKPSQNGWTMHPIKGKASIDFACN